MNQNVDLGIVELTGSSHQTAQVRVELALKVFSKNKSGKVPAWQLSLKGSPTEKIEAFCEH